MSKDKDKHDDKAPTGAPDKAHPASDKAHPALDKPASDKPAAPAKGFAPGEGEGAPATEPASGYTGGRSKAEMDPRRNEGSDPALVANNLVPSTDSPPAMVAENPKKRTGKDIRWADDLITALVETGTGGDKILVIQRAKVVKFELGENYGLPETDPNHNKRTELKKNDPKRHLTAKEALKALEDSPEVGDVTKAKARAICKTGSWTPGTVSNPALDAHVPAPPTSAPVDDEDDTDDTEESAEDIGSVKGGKKEPDAGTVKKPEKPKK